jgi:hypothetical protein
MASLPLDQALEQIAAGAAVAARAAGVLDLLRAGRSRREGGGDGVVGDPAAEADDHGQVRALIVA